jgi:hypothetical protein
MVGPVAGAKLIARRTHALDDEIGGGETGIIGLAGHEVYRFFS